MDVLSRTELDFFAKEGYVVARQVIDRDQAERTGRAVWAFTGMDPGDPKTWYPEDRRGIMVEIYHHQTMWDNRTAPRVHRAFSQIWGTDKLWVSHDRASINPPALDKDAPEHNLHWDATLDKRPLSFGVQGVLYLSDTPAEQGAFICVPGFHQRLDAWLDELPEGANPREQDLLALGTRRIGAEAGDSGYLAHGPAAYGERQSRRCTSRGAVHHYESSRRERRGAAGAHGLLAAASVRAGALRRRTRASRREDG